MTTDVLHTLRHHLHRHADLSGQEQRTAGTIQKCFSPLAPDQILTGLGGAGMAFVFGSSPGPSIPLRCGLDALIASGNELFLPLIIAGLED
ncbi:MAG: hypothetical protein PsegKO_30240 [Pseudohongiellaceae bacterium]